MRISDWSSDVCSSDLRFLDPILRGDLWFCQGFSEPQSGSDLASVRTRAVRDGDHYIVSGQKTWTTTGHMADFMICLCRTNPDVKPQAGLSRSAERRVGTECARTCTSRGPPRT